MHICWPSHPEGPGGFLAGCERCPLPSFHPGPVLPMFPNNRALPHVTSCPKTHGRTWVLHVKPNTRFIWCQSKYSQSCSAASGQKTLAGDESRPSSARPASSAPTSWHKHIVWHKLVLWRSLLFRVISRWHKHGLLFRVISRWHTHMGLHTLVLSRFLRFF